MYKLTFFHFLLISDINNHFVHIYTKTQKTCQKLTNLDFVSVFHDVSDVLDVD